MKGRGSKCKNKDIGWSQDSDREAYSAYVKRLPLVWGVDPSSYFQWKKKKVVEACG